jgi:hypothetical protein
MSICGEVRYDELINGSEVAAADTGISPDNQTRRYELYVKGGHLAHPV